MELLLELVQLLPGEGRAVPANVLVGPLLSRARVALVVLAAGVFRVMRFAVSGGTDLRRRLCLLLPLALKLLLLLLLLWLLWLLLGGWLCGVQQVACAKVQLSLAQVVGRLRVAVESGGGGRRNGRQVVRVVVRLLEVVLVVVLVVVLMVVREVHPVRGEESSLLLLLDELMLHGCDVALDEFVLMVCAGSLPELETCRSA